MTDFITLTKERRSANKFIPGIDIPDEDFEHMFNLVKYGPSAFNLQHTHYVVVKDAEVKDSIYELAANQYKVKTASAIVLVLGNMDAYKDAAKINEGLLHLGVMDQVEYDMTIKSVTEFYEERGDVFMREEAIRNASLSAQLFMMAAKDKGWDTCPMIGFDPEAMKQILRIPDRYVPAVMIAIGKEDSSSRRPRGYRKPVGEFVSFNRF